MLDAQYPHVDALPGVEFDAYPPNALQFHEIIELLDLPEAHRVESLEFEIEVAEVCNPTHFWYLLYSPKHSVALYNMTLDMNDFYDSPAGDEYKIRYQAAKPKIFCAARYHADWQRAQMLTYCFNNQLKVRHIDFGTIAYLNISEVRFLKREWADLPAQAMRGRLSGIRPDSLDKEWPLKATRFFLRLIMEKRVIATTCSYDDEHKVLDMFITDTSRDEDIHITDELVDKGLARICSEEEADDYRAADSSLFEKYEQCLLEHFCHLMHLDRFECSVTNDPPGYSVNYDEDNLEKLLAKFTPCKLEHFTAVLLNEKNGREEMQMPDETEERQERDSEDFDDATVPTEIPVLPMRPYSNIPPLSHEWTYLSRPRQPMQPVENQPRPVEYPHQPPRPVEYSQQPPQPIEYPHQPLQSVENPSQPVEYQPLQPVENTHQLPWPVEYPPLSGCPKSCLDSARRRQYNVAPFCALLQNSPSPNAVPPQNVLPQNTSLDATAIVRPERAVQLQPRAAKQNESEQTSQPEESTPSCRNHYIEHRGYIVQYGKRVNIYKSNGRLWLSPYQMILLFWKDKNLKAPESLIKFRAILEEKLTEDVLSMHSVAIDKFGKAFLLAGFFEFSNEMLAICKDVLIPLEIVFNFVLMFDHLLDIVVYDLNALVHKAKTEI